MAVIRPTHSYDFTTLSADVLRTIEADFTAAVGIDSDGTHFQERRDDRVINLKQSE